MERNASHPLASTLVQVALDEGINLNTSTVTDTGTRSNGNNNALLALPVVSDLKNSNYPIIWKVKKKAGMSHYK
jgi:hypothetical protein